MFAPVFGRDIDRQAGGQGVVDHRLIDLHSSVKVRHIRRRRIKLLLRNRVLGNFIPL